MNNNPSNDNNNNSRFNLSDLNLNYVNLVRELNGILEKPNPKILISKWWHSKHMPYDLQRIDYITAYVEKINLANQSILNLQSKLAVNQEVLEMMIAGAFAEAERRAEIQLAGHINELQKIEDEKLGRQLQLKAQELLNNKQHAENAKTTAEANLISIQGMLAQKIMNDIDLKNLTVPQLLLMIKALDTKASADLNFMANDAFLEQILKQAEAETKKRFAEAKKAEVQANLEDWDAKETMKIIK